MNTRAKTLGSEGDYDRDCADRTGPGRRLDGGEPVDDRPRSVYELMTRRMLDEMREDVNDIKGRVNALLWMVAGAVLLEFIVRLVK
ncbi:MAG: hypothetical protein ABJA50_07050 [Chloroflexota bacterium]